jgi:peptidoglycan LD-endopeptidase LytH
MASPDAFKQWLLSYRPSIEVIRGLHAGVMPGALTDAEVGPGDRLRAGGYAEDRSIYSQELFAPPGEEPRTVHLGIDIFAPVQAEVFAPLNAQVHSFQDNARPGDYGPTIILEHMIDGGAFHTLYGHLSRASLSSLAPGKMIRTGERVGWLGAKTENGGWPPHLHFQIILDLKGMSGDYPGVCRRSEREHWLSVCPDPARLLGIQSV